MNTVMSDKKERQQPNGGVKWSGESVDSADNPKSQKIANIYSIQSVYCEDHLTVNDIIPTKIEQIKKLHEVSPSSKVTEDYDKIEIAPDDDVTPKTKKIANVNDNDKHLDLDEYVHSLWKWPRGRSWFTKVLFYFIRDGEQCSF